MKQLRIFKSDNSWLVAHFDHDEPDPVIVGLFDTHILPTPFMNSMSEDEVIARIQILNPDTSVISVDLHAPVIENIL